MLQPAIFLHHSFEDLPQLFILKGFQGFAYQTEILFSRFRYLGEGVRDGLLPRPGTLPKTNFRNGSYAGFQA